MLYSGIDRMRFENGGVRFKPYLPEGINEFEIKDLRIKNDVFNVKITGKGNRIKTFSLNAETVEDAFVKYGGENEERTYR